MLRLKKRNYILAVGILCYVDRAAISIYAACNETNLMHCLSSVYSVTIPLHVSGLLVAINGTRCPSQRTVGGPSKVDEDIKHVPNVINATIFSK
jgi:hypothetical protein